MITQKEKADRFRTLHDGPGAFENPNAVGCRFRPHSRRTQISGISYIERSSRQCCWPKRSRAEPR